MTDSGSAPVATRVETAFDSAARKRGLLGRDSLEPGTALVLAPCGAIHMFGMRFAIDVIFAARDGRVLKVARNVRPGRIAVCFRAFAAIELAAGEADTHGIAKGDYLRVEPT
jgi:uncharacterized membrane protein (UPF0127 family)